MEDLLSDIALDNEPARLRDCSGEEIPLRKDARWSSKERRIGEEYGSSTGD